jgi:2'-5' RNA ligase
MRTPPTSEQVAAVVEKAIKSAGLNPNQAAKLSHLPPATLARKISSGDYHFTLKELGMLAPVLGTTVSALIAEAEEDTSSAA